MGTQSRDQFYNLHKVSFDDQSLAQFFYHVPSSQAECYSKISPLNGRGHAGIARIYISYLIKQLFNIHRLPGFDDSIRACSRDEIKQFFSSLDEAVVEKHSRELMRVYKHTVSTLKEAAQSDKVIVRRGLSHDMALLVACAKLYATEHNQNCFTIFGNVFDFYAIAPAGGFDDGVSLVRAVPIEDILLCHQTVNGFSQIDSDLLLINRSARGMITIELDQISIDDTFKVSEEAYSVYAASIEEGRVDNARSFQDMYRDLEIFYPEPVRVMAEKRGFYESLFARMGAMIDGNRQILVCSRLPAALDK